MKKNLAITLATALIISLFAGCVSTQAPASPAGSASSTAPTASTASGTTQTPKAEQVEVDSTVASLVEEASKLSDLEALAFFESLSSKGLTDGQIIQFFIDLPISQANKQIYDMYINEGLDNYANSYPKGKFYDDFEWSIGMGKEIDAPFSKYKIKLPFSDDYIPIPEGPIGDPNKTYTVGVLSGGLLDPWIANYQDGIGYEAARHSNVKMVYMDYNFDMSVYATQMDTLIAQKVDAIVTWPMIEASSGPPAKRAEEAGIPVISSDRVTGYEGVASRITGNFPANGAQNGMYLVWKLAQETGGKEVKANVVLTRKPVGSTADTIRAGFFLKVISYFPNINILQTYHDADNREEAFVNAQNAFQAHQNIDAIFSGDATKAVVAYEAAKNADRLNSREGGKKIILLSIDDSKELFSLMMKEKAIEMNTPYTPMIGDISLRAALLKITGQEVPQDIATPNIPMVTQTGDVVFGLKTQTPEQWYQYTFGPEIK